MSGNLILNIVLGFGYFVQVLAVFGLLFEVRRLNSSEFGAVMTKKSLFVELLFVVGIISFTVASQNWFSFPDTIDSAVFVWRIIFNFWSISIWVRWWLFAHKIKKKIEYGRLEHS